MGLNNDKQIKLYETDGAVRNLLYSYQIVVPVEQRQNRERCYLNPTLSKGVCVWEGGG